MQLIFNIVSTMFIMYICFRWSSTKFYDLLMKCVLCLVTVLGIILLIKQLNLV